MATKDTANNEIASLVERFEEQFDSYKRAEYNETLARHDFIDPFFKALGWDINNENGYAESYREVIHEDRVKVGKATKAPDYSFRLVGGKRLFFVEAKKPSVFVKGEIIPAYQVRRYGWSAKLPISIITDFEEFAVYDCTRKPNPTDKASVARIKYLTYQDYLKEFDFIWETFSKERVLKGSFDKFITSNAGKRGTATVDKEFLQSLDSWRTYLATSISWNNKNLDEEEINFVVQQTIDRIIFLRIAEDRDVEQYGNLQQAIKQGNFYQNLFYQFQQADDKYNSGLFDFRKDKISKTLSVDNKVLKTIINELYYPESPYEFSVLSVEILGSAYEQFLGKQIKIDKAHRAHIEEKPEVRKAGGVYYTPQYIVEYIVKNTVGKLTENKTPKEIRKIKIVDPACGSGSFLIGAYQYLLDWHRNYYHERHAELVSASLNQGQIPKRVRNDDKLLTPEGNLTTAEKKRILLNNIFGVDIDVNAVEVTKLSLLLKCLEGETEASIASQLKLFNERILPTLDNNIKDGNSLVDIDLYNSQLDFGEEKKIKPFSWQKAFVEVFKQGGFDVVIGNPPYGATLTKEVDTYLRSKYQVANYQLDTYILFIERGKRLLNKSGYLGFIIPSAWVASTYDNKLRKYLTEDNRIENFVITPKQTFKDASVETCILILSNNLQSKSFEVERWDTKEKSSYSLNTKEIQFENFYVFPVYADYKTNKVVHKIRKQKNVLNDFADVSWGIKAYQKGKGKPPQKGFESESKIYHSDKRKNKTHKPLLGGREINRFCLNWKGGFIDYGDWLAEPRKPRWFEGERILVREVTANGIVQATFVEDDYVFSNSVDGIKMRSKDLSIKFLLGLINSKLISFYHSNTSANAFKGAFPKVLLQDLRELPVPKPDTKTQNEIENLVNQLLQLNQEKAETNLQTKVSQLDGRIEYCESRINEIVYQLYELTPDEIKIVEGK
ncbi:MAG: N-6 DNA methylase [Chitinophagales bacterium]|nr:N-6 DNA methylase [Chitinophagales bacterium]